MSRDKYMYAIPVQREIKLNARTPRKFKLLTRAVCLNFKISVIPGSFTFWKQG
jgi:hypothetical protein